MSIEDRGLKLGTKLVARYKGQEHTAEVVETGEGIRYRLEDGREFKSPSAACSAVMGGKACNGWRFWSIADGETREAKAPTKRSGKGGGARSAGHKAKPNGLLSPLDDGRYFCSACQEPFDVPAGVEPQGCPKGHGAEHSPGSRERRTIASREAARPQPSQGTASRRQVRAKIYPCALLTPSPRLHRSIGRWGRHAARPAGS